MTPHLKSPVTRDKAYLSHIRTLPCLVTGREGSEHEPVVPAHFRTGTNGGTGLKPSDFFVLPLSNTEHGIQHSMPELTYWLGAVNENPWLLAEFMRGYMQHKYTEWANG